jgi:hypothetical protein
VARFIRAIGEKTPKGWGDLLRQLALFACADFFYEVVRGMSEGKAVVAFANAHTIIDVEKAPGTFFEPHLQAFLIPAHAVISVLNFAYLNTHFVVTTAFLVWLYLFRNETYYFVRNMFMVAMGLALVGYAAFPAAPPRLIQGVGFVDTIHDISHVNQDSSFLKVLVNPYAAFPSMHIAFALMVGIPAARLSRHPAAKVAWSLYPAFVFLVIVATANHFWIDAAGGVIVAAVSALVASRLLARARPAVWAWRTAPGEARA